MLNSAHFSLSSLIPLLFYPFRLSVEPTLRPSMATVTTPVHSIFTSSSLHLRPTLRPRTVRVSASTISAVVSAPPPAYVPAKSGIYLVDPEDKDKIHRMKLVYEEKVVPLLVKEFGYTNVHQIPKLEKITLNCGIGDAQQNKKGLEDALKNLAIIAGQKPFKTVAKKSVASFKVREGSILGVAVNLRRKYMYSFLDRLINLALPRTTDFQGVNPGSFDGNGNYSLGLTNQAAFPELDSYGKQKGLDICIKTTAKTDEEARFLLTLLGMPFKEKADEVLVKKKKYSQHHFLSKE